MSDRLRTGLDWEDVRFFTALARLGSLSATARALGVNHATVARRIGGLEAALGAALFERRPGGYVLTDRGRAALEAASAMEGAAQALAGAGPSQALAGLVRLTTTPGLADGFLIPRLGALGRRYPGLDMEIIADRRLVSLPRHEADIALRLGRPDEGELLARRVATLGFGLYATPAWRERLAAGAAPVFVGFDETSAHLPEALWLGRRFPRARLALRSNSQLSQAAAARADCGIAVLPHVLAGDLVALDLAEPPPARELWLLTRPDIAAVPRIRAAADFIADLVRRERRLFEGPAAGLQPPVAAGPA